MRTPSRLRPIAGALLGLPLAASASASASASWVGYSALFVPHRLASPAAVSGERREFASTAGPLSYYRCGPAAPTDPLLLVHSVNAAAAAYEVRPLYEHYCKTRTVYALELPGFGFSARRDRAYTPRLMTDAILAMASEIAAAHGGAAIDALALSLSSEFLARAAAERPAAFRSIALVSPTGFSRNMPAGATPGGTRGMPALRRILSFPLWSRALYDLLASKPSIRFFLQKAWGSKDIDEGLLEYDYLTTHQPGAPYAPYFLSAVFCSASTSSKSIDPCRTRYGCRTG
ncbi:MAG: alpha/beta fold hydrolase [Stellaceae bacterium]